ncbi:MAG: SURF1 family protein [Candidatus Saccharibacteria bacterium]|nr:SURF1 family protein [Pseudorhodobacter sp.]
MRRFMAPLLIGVIGAAILVGLGVWQMSRMVWKQAMLDEISAMMVQAPVALPAVVDAEHDRYRGVMVSGRFTGDAVFKLDSLEGQGPGKRVIAVFETTGGRRVLVDRGLWLDGTDAEPKLAHGAQVTGNLDWPRETDSFTPPPDAKTGLWFARDVPAMAAMLGTEPVLIVARKSTGDGIVPAPVDTSSIPNNHWQYVVTWFSLALVWLGMTAYWLWRIRHPDQRG